MKLNDERSLDNSKVHITEKRSFPAALFLLTLIVVSSRELFSLYSNKTFAYGVQVAFLCLLSIRMAFIIKIKRKDLLLVMFIISLVFLSLLLSSANFKVSALSAFSVVAVNFLNLWLLILSIILAEQRSLISIGSRSILTICRLLSLWVVIFAYLDLFDVINFSGGYGFLENTRLVGAFGSMQHFSIFISIMTVVMLDISFSRRKYVDFVILALLVSALAMAYTRIGYFILIFCVSIFSTHAILIKNKMKLRLMVCGFLLFVVPSFVSVVFIFPEGVNNVLQRLSMINIDDASNIHRFSHWRSGLELYLSGFLVVGSDTGLASQIPKIMFDEDSFHFESGQIQYLVNFGFVMWAIVAYLFYRWYRSLPKESIGSFLPIVLWISLYIYMFNDIVPIYVLFLLITLISTNMKLIREPLINSPARR